MKAQKYIYNGNICIKIKKKIQINALKSVSLKEVNETFVKCKKKILYILIK